MNEASGKFGNNGVLALIVVLVAFIALIMSASDWVEERIGPPDYTRLQDSSHGDLAASLCGPRSGTPRPWCRHYQQLVPTSEAYDEAAVARWRDTHFPNMCGRMARGQDSSRQWCADYLHLMPEHASYVGDEALLQWLRDGNRFRYVCYKIADSKTDLRVLHECRGWFHARKHSWREAPTTAGEGI